MSPGWVRKVHKSYGLVWDISPFRSMSLLREDWLSGPSKYSCFKEPLSKLCWLCCPCLLLRSQSPNKVCAGEALTQEDICCICNCSSRPSPLGSGDVCYLCLMSRKCLDFPRLHSMPWKYCCVHACMCLSLKSVLWRKHFRFKCWLVKKNYFVLKDRLPLPQIVSG